MKTLYQALIEFDMAQLQALAECRGAALTTSHRIDAAHQLADALLSPAAVAIALADMPDREKEALQLLLRHKGQLETPRFIRQFGEIRLMGAARIKREKPWLNPASPAEALWYKGFIFSMFRLTDQGSREYIYIPGDLQPLLKSALDYQEPEAELPDAVFNVRPVAAPQTIIRGQGRLRENVFRLLLYLQVTPVRIQANARLSPKDRQALLKQLLPPPFPAFTPHAELDFLLHLAQRAGLLVVRYGRLRPDPDPTRAWLQSHPARQARFLQQTWRGDPTWNDLWHTPGLHPQPTGWENSPLLARSKILEYLQKLTASPGNWYVVDDFIAAIKQTDPDFQRPTGDYNTWYIQDEAGNYLMGFENWDKVEGALIRYMLTHLLPLLEVVELGANREEQPPTVFRLTASGSVFLNDQSIPPPQRQQPAFLQADKNFRVYVAAEASMYDRFQLARFAQLETYADDRVVYRLTQASVGRALRNGVTAEQMVAFLNRATNSRTPLNVVETLHQWEARQDSVRLENVTLLRVKNPRVLVELRNHVELASLLGEVVSPTAVLVPPQNLREVRRLLLELGYLETGEHS